MKIISNILILITLLSVSFSQAQDFDFAKNQVNVWKLAKDRTIAVAKAMPQESYNYTPTENVKNFGQQMSHIANSMLSMHARFILNKKYSGSEKDASKMSKNQIINALESAFNKVINDLKGLSDSVLKTEGKKHGAFPLTKWQSLLFMRDHITNHRAKAVLYLRLNNINPPRYGFN